MRSSLSLLCLLGLIVTLVLAAPAPNNRVQKRSFKVERVRNPNFKRHDGPAQLLKAYRKYGIRPPQALMDRLNEQAAARKAQQAEAKANAAAGSTTNKAGKKHKHHNTTTTTMTTTIAATSATSAASAVSAAASALSSAIAASNSTSNSTAGDGTGLVENTPVPGDVEYLAPVSIGGQTLNMDFDTGSSDLWVFNTQLSTKVQSGHSLFDPSKSSTFAMIDGATFDISYGDGSQVVGNVGTDTVDIGGATATKQAIELATSVSTSFQEDVLNDGLVGLAFSQLNTVQPTQQKTFFDNIKDDLAEPLFTADLRANATGAYEFGAIDASKFTGTMNFVDVNTTQGFWQFSSTTFAVGANGTVQTGDASGQAIADTGTTLLLANAEIVNGYFSQVDGAANNEQVGGITLPCDATPPDLQLDVGGVMATVKGADMVFEQVSDNTCFAGMQPITGSLMIFGDVFFKSNFVVFNGGNNTLGFATHA